MGVVEYIVLKEGEYVYIEIDEVIYRVENVGGKLTYISVGKIKKVKKACEGDGSGLGAV
ncbi:hypothetical protein [Thermococcus sp.]